MRRYPVYSERRCSVVWWVIDTMADMTRKRMVRIRIYRNWNRYRYWNMDSKHTGARDFLCGHYKNIAKNQYKNQE